MGNIHLVTGCAGAEHITSADQGAFNAALIGTGQFVLEKGNSLAVQVISNNQIRVLDGELMMQGRFVRLEPGTYVDLAIENGEQGKLRNDLIAARYTKDASTGFESVDLVVIKGSAVASNPVDPAVTEGDITDGAAVLHEFPLWRIPLEGLNIGTPVALFGEPFMDSMRTLPEIRHSVETIHKEVDDQLADYDVQMAKKIAAIESYTKEETLSEDTKVLFGLGADATPDDAFVVIKDLLGIQFDLLWENASPTSDFAAQTVTVDLSDYDMIAIEHYTVTISASYSPGASRNFQVVPKYFDSIYLSAVSTYLGGSRYAYGNATRKMSLSGGSISFAAGVGFYWWRSAPSGSSSTDTCGMNTSDPDVCIPVKIYGIRRAEVE